MYKNIFYLLIFILTSCVSKERVPYELVVPKYTVMGVVRPDDSLHIKLLKSLSAYETFDDSTIISSGSDAIVSYSINGGYSQQMKYSDDGFYADYILRKDDIIKLDIRNNEDRISPITVQTQVLSPPKFTITPTEIASQTRTPNSSSVKYPFYDNITVSSLSVNNSSNYTVKIFDNPETEDYYMLSVNGIWDMTNNVNIGESILFNRDIEVTPLASPFMDTNISVPLHGFASGYSSVINDKDFNGKDLEFIMNVRIYSNISGIKLTSNNKQDSFNNKFKFLYESMDEGNGYFYFKQENEYLSPFFYMTISRIDKSTYLYAKSIQYYLSNLKANGIFKEPNYIYSNIEDGYGIMGAISPGGIRYFTKEGKEIDSLIYCKSGDEFILDIGNIGINGEWCISDFSAQDYYVDMEASDSISLGKKDFLYLRKAYKLEMWEVGPNKRRDVVFGWPIYTSYTDTESGIVKYDYDDGVRLNILDDKNIHIHTTNIANINPARCSIEFTDTDGQVKTVALIIEK